MSNLIVVAFENYISAVRNDIITLESLRFAIERPYTASKELIDVKASLSPWLLLRLLVALVTSSICSRLGQ